MALQELQRFKLTKSVTITALSNYFLKLGLLYSINGQILIVNDVHSPCLSQTNPFAMSFLDALADG